LTALLEVAHSKDGERALATDTFGFRLKRLREQAGLTQLELAQRAGMNQFSVAKLEQDQYSPSWPTVQSLAKALDCTCTAFEGTVEPTAEEKEKKAPGKRGRPRKTPPAGQPEPPAGEAAPADEGKAKRRKGK
jgi:DNA-binding XRE family transcriptional regulator